MKHTRQTFQQKNKVLGTLFEGSLLRRPHFLQEGLINVLNVLFVITNEVIFIFCIRYTANAGPSGHGSNQRKQKKETCCNKTEVARPALPARHNHVWFEAFLSCFVNGEVIELLTGRNSEISLVSLRFSFGEIEAAKLGISSGCMK
jgi:hypothetical protein